MTIVVDANEALSYNTFATSAVSNAAGSVLALDLGGNAYSLSFVVTPEDTNGIVVFSIISEDLAGHRVVVTSVTSGANVLIGTFNLV